MISINNSDEMTITERSCTDKSCPIRPSYGNISQSYAVAATITLSVHYRPFSIMSIRHNRCPTSVTSIVPFMPSDKERARHSKHNKGEILPYQVLAMG